MPRARAAGAAEARVRRARRSVERRSARTRANGARGGRRADGEAMREGAPLIYQAQFFDGRWQGRADFLRRMPGRSDLGDHAYEVLDTKLARQRQAAGRPSAQRSTTGCSETSRVARPAFAHVVLGDGTTAQSMLRRYAALHRHVVRHVEAGRRAPRAVDVSGASRALRDLPAGCGVSRATHRRRPPEPRRRCCVVISAEARGPRLADGGRACRSSVEGLEPDLRRGKSASTIPAPPGGTAGRVARDAAADAPPPGTRRAAGYARLPSAAQATSSSTSKAIRTSATAASSTSGGGGPPGRLRVRLGARHGRRRRRLRALRRPRRRAARAASRSPRLPLRAARALEAAVTLGRVRDSRGRGGRAPQR